MKSDNELRVWWIPQIPMDEIFYVEVEDIKEAKKLINILAHYDHFQFNYNDNDSCSAILNFIVYDSFLLFLHQTIIYEAIYFTQIFFTIIFIDCFIRCL